ncbi:MAG: family 43 glycosylhydrolase [Treponema sp.]|nr:family 43 glycosylhydrolase [Treponema sp.]
MKKTLLMFCAASLILFSSYAVEKTRKNGEAWTDTAGNVIQAHDTVVKCGSTYYWYGLDYSHEKDIGDGNGFRAVKCYESEDLVKWTFKNNVLTNTTTDLLYHCDVWAPQVVYNKKTGMYVMWVGTSKGCMVFVSSTPYGNFHLHDTTFNINAWAYVNSIFVDSDGEAYVVSECLSDLSVDEPALMVYALTDDYLGLRTDWNSWGDIFNISFDSRAIGRTFVLKHKGVYYLFAADYGTLSGNAYSTDNRPSWHDFISGNYTYKGLKWAWSNSLYDEWSGLTAFDNTSTAYEFGSLIAVQGEEGTSYIVACNGWNSTDLSQSTYTWLPLQWNNSTFLQMDVPVVGDYSTIIIDAEKGTVRGN